MDIGNALNVLISLLFVFLLMSLITSVFEELVAGIWNSRGRLLRRAVGQMLGDTDLRKLSDELYAHPLVAGLTRPGWDVPLPGWLAAVLPGLRARQPSYIAPEVFADAVTDILTQDDAFRSGNIDGGLGALWRSSAGDIAAFRTKLIAWFKEGTAREGGVYRRSAQRWLLAYGLMLAVALNVDTLSIARHLWENRATQEVADIVAKAQAHVGASGQAVAAAGATQATLDDLIKDLRGLKLPIGWNNADGCAIARAIAPGTVELPVVRSVFGWFCCGVEPTAELDDKAEPKAAVARPIDGGTVSFGRWLGWLITALAVSLGAQFWFDTLGKVVGLRAAGRRPDGTSTTTTTTTTG